MPLTVGSSWDLVTTIDTTTVTFLQMGNIVMVRGGGRFIFLTIAAGVVSFVADIDPADGLSLITLLGQEYLFAKDAADQTLMRVFKEPK